MDQNIASFTIFSTPRDSGMDRIYSILEDGSFQEALFDEASISFINQIAIGHAPKVFSIISNSFDRRLLLLLEHDNASVILWGLILKDILYR